MQKKENSFSHTYYNIKQYGKRYGVGKLIRVFYHYSFRVIKSLYIDVKQTQVNVNGYKLNLIPEDQGISKELLFFKTHEPVSTSLINSELRKGMVCLDIGANIGYYVLLESKAIGKDGRIIAIEPSPDNFKFLQKNIDGLNAKNIEAYNFAAGHTEGQIRFFLNERSNGCKALLENEEPPNRPGKVIQVPIRRLDSFIDEKKIDRIDFLRMDVEGFELYIIEGMKNALKKYKPIIQLELHKRQIGEEGTKKFFKIMKDLGYEVKNYIPRDLDVPLIGTMKDVKNYNIETLLQMLEGGRLPSYLMLILINKQ